MEGKSEVTYEYQTKPALAVIGMLMFFGMSYAGVHIATTNEKALRLFSITFSPTVLSILMWGFAAVTFYIACKLVLIFIQSRKGPRLITLTKSGITAPATVTAGKYTTVNFNSIKDIKIQKNSGKLFLHIHHTNGKMVIPSVALGSDSLFQELVAKLNVSRSAKG